MNLDKNNTSLLADLSLKNKKSLTEIALKMAEETGEVSSAVLSVTNSSGSEYKDNSNDDIIEEVVDVIMVAKSILYKLDVSPEIYNDIFATKLEKWNNKTNGK